MPSIVSGDRAQHFFLSRHGRALKSQLQTLSQEISTGRHQDTGHAVNGDFRALGQIEAGLTRLEAFNIAISETTLASETMQLSLERISDASNTLSATLLLATATPTRPQLDAAGLDARTRFDQVISALNTESGGRGLFAGTASDGAALANADTILADIGIAIAGMTSATDIISTMDAWFEDPGLRFDAIAYQGATTDIGAISVGPNDAADLSLRADDPKLRQVLKSFAIASLLADPSVLDGDTTERAELARQSGSNLLEGAAGLADLSSAIGLVQARIEEVRIENLSERNALELARSDLVDADPYEAATKLEAVQTQLEMHYSITARLSRLSLLDFIR